MTEAASNPLPRKKKEEEEEEEDSRPPSELN